MVQLRVTAIPEVAIHQSSGFSRFTDRLDIPGLGKGLRLRFRLVNTRQAREAEARSGYRVPGTPYLTAGANSGKSGRARREQALRLMGMRPARLEPLALRAPGHERMVNGRAAAGGEKRIELSETIAWFGDILNMDGPLVEIGLRSVFNNSAIGARQGSFGHALATGKDRWRCRRASRRRHREAQAGTPKLLSIPDNGAWLNLPWLNLLSADLWAGWGKTPRKGVEKAIFS
jgi:hypothetical protein